MPQQSGRDRAALHASHSFHILLLFGMRPLRGEALRRMQWFVVGMMQVSLVPLWEHQALHGVFRV